MTRRNDDEASQRFRRRPAPLSPRAGRRLRLADGRRALGRRRLAAQQAAPGGDRRPSAAGCCRRRISRRRPSASSTCTCWAPCRRPTRSTTSRCWRRCTGRSCPPRCGAACGCPRWCRARRRSRWSDRLAKFQPGGKSGAMVSDLMPYTRKIVDDLCIIRTMHTEHVNHDPASKFLHTGFQIAGRPSAGAWINYALGSNNQDLPAFIVMSSGNRERRADRRGGVGARVPAVALPGRAVPIRARTRCRTSPTPTGQSRQDRREMLDAIADVATIQHQASKDPEIPSKLSQYEMSYRMQSSVPQVADISDEPDHVLDLYGPDVRRPGHVRAQLPAGAAAGRARRALHDGGPARMGSPLRHPAAAAGLVRDRRSAVRRAGRRPQAARHARRHAGDLRHRVRAHLVRAGGAEGRLRPRSSRRQLQRLDGGRRREGRHRSTARPTTSATTSPRTRSTSTTSTPPSCGRSASITRS